jgi:formate hydrogenlyase subunit 3/multisubunit Na+/H+ antiporter MnhD subunit
MAVDITSADLQPYTGADRYADARAAFYSIHISTIGFFTLLLCLAYFCRRQRKTPWPIPLVLFFLSIIGAVICVNCRQTVAPFTVAEAMERERVFPLGLWGSVWDAFSTGFVVLSIWVVVSSPRFLNAFRLIGKFGKRVFTASQRWSYGFRVSVWFRHQAAPAREGTPPRETKNAE